MRCVALLDQRRLGERDRGAGRGAPARRIHTIAFVGYDGGRIAAERPRRPRGRHALGAHPPDPGGPGQRLPRAARAGRAAAPTACQRGMSGPPSVGRARVRGRVDGTVQGVGFRPYVYRLANELGLGGFVLQRRPRRGDRGRGRRAAVGALPRAAAAEAPPLARVEAARSAPAVGAERGERGLRDRRRAPGGGEPDALVSRRHRDLRRTAWPSCSTPPTAATATRSSTAPTAGRGSRSCAASPTTGRSRRWPASRCAPRAAPSTRIRSTGASTPSRTPAPTAGRPCRLLDRAGERRSERQPTPIAAAAARAARGRDRRGQGRRRLPPRLPRRRRGRRRGAARPQAPRGQAVRADGRRPRGGRASWSSSATEEQRCSSRRSGRSCSPAGARARRSRAAVAPRVAASSA